MVRALGPAAQQVRSQARDRATACPPSWAPLDQDGASFSQEFEWSFVLLSVLGAFSVLLGCDMTNTSCCCSAVAVCERRVFFFCVVWYGGVWCGVV